MLYLMPYHIGKNLSWILLIPEFRFIHQTTIFYHVNEREEFMQETQHTQQTATRKAQNQDKKTA